MKKHLLFVLTLGLTFGANAQFNFYPQDSSFYFQDVVDQYGNYFTYNAQDASGIQDGAIFSVTNTELGDAFDGAFECFLYEEDSAYINMDVSINGLEYTNAEQIIGDFGVSKVFLFNNDRALVRCVYKVRNLSSSSKTVTFGTYTNVGSDGDTEIITTSDLADTLTETSRWTVSYDGNLPNDTEYGDPIIGLVRKGTGTLISTPGLVDVLGSDIGGYVNDGLYDTLSLTIPANDYRMVMQFATMDSIINIDSLQARHAIFNNVSAMQAQGVLSGLTGADLLRIVNWDFSSLFAGLNDNISMNESALFDGLTVTPNPTLGEVTITSKHANNVTVRTLNGKLIEQTENAFMTQKLDLSSHPAGLYLVTVNIAGFEKTYRIVKN